MTQPQVDFKEAIFALFIGRSASGKSAAAASFPGRFLEIDFDGRANGILNAINQGWLKQDKIDIKKFATFEGLQTVIDYLNSLYLEMRNLTVSYKSIDVASLYSLCRFFEASSMMAPRSESKGIIRGLSAITEPFDYKFESQMAHRVMDFLRAFTCNVTMSAHVLNQYGKKAGAPQYTPAEIIGEKLNITANLGESILALFNDVYKFDKEIEAGKEKFTVEFSTEICRNSYGLPPGKFNITRKPFYPFLVEKIMQVRNGIEVKPDSTATKQLFNFGG